MDIWMWGKKQAPEQNRWIIKNARIIKLYYDYLGRLEFQRTKAKELDLSFFQETKQIELKIYYEIEKELNLNVSGLYFYADKTSIVVKKV